MSQTEFQRFVTAMQTTPALAETYSTAATPADLAGRLRADGYDVTEAEVQDGLRQAAASTGELSDEQLDDVSGGAVIAMAMTSVFGIGLASVLAGTMIGLAADAARRGILPKG